jgi:hypothetical protein
MAQLLLLLLARTCARSTAAAKASHGQPAAAGKLLPLSLQAGTTETLPNRRLQDNGFAAADLQQTLQRMLAVPLVTPHSVLAPGSKLLEAGSLRNWHLLARKLSTPGANVTIVVFGGSVTVGYATHQEAWKNSIGGWVEPMVANWLKVMHAATGARFADA